MKENLNADQGGTSQVGIVDSSLDGNQKNHFPQPLREFQSRCKLYDCEFTEGYTVATRKRLLYGAEL